MTGLAGIWLLRGKLYCRAALARRGACLLQALVAPPPLIGGAARAWAGAWRRVLPAPCEGHRARCAQTDPLPKQSLYGIL